MSGPTTLPLPFGEHPLGAGVVRCVLGPLELRLHRLKHELRLSAYTDRAEPRRAAVVEVPWEGPELPAGAELQRFGFPEAPDRVRLLPALADRPTIIRPELPFWVQSGDSVQVYVSSPIWVQVALTNGRVLTELPTLRPSDTWFGPNTTRGELCYALATPLRLVLDDSVRPPGRAFTPVLVHNDSPTPMNLARLRLPVPNLSLWADAGGRMLTEAVTLRHTGEQDLAEITLGDKPPESLEAQQFVAGPREPLTRSFALRAIESVWRGGGR